ncbi:hypothetical protein VOLCADRAFT_97018 [Volvox carteri f. nagariensis]|uniref:Uncharacterized protein n=1 Tax=Volvox carteri f. nagariensis TaxID=3068 RepID=D8UBP1_VOLCA|nr:uncharacterized protein VOLCADRAFT_97018 [Volvox carteri f. nagariensis]EFJ42857.1 hypothetical protein VOLCADRAFT_97018 [Volvox carteri f. nagariensis]|eukprot:XP_002956117.1 hypothetical protein VOLCADRAFT_97018 [Volvox carteri f. nagariensis]
METRFQYDLHDKQLRFHVRQRAITENKLEMKATGLLDPGNCNASYRAALKQYVSTSGGEFKDSGSKPLRLGAGVAVVSQLGGVTAKPAATRGSAAAAAAKGGAPAYIPLLTVSADKKLALLEGPDTVLTLRAVADFDLTARQLSLFLQARENNWAATLREGRVTLTYDL